MKSKCSLTIDSSLDTIGWKYEWVITLKFRLIEISWVQAEKKMIQERESLIRALSNGEITQEEQAESLQEAQGLEEIKLAKRYSATETIQSYAIAAASEYEKVNPVTKIVSNVYSLFKQNMGIIKLCHRKS